MVQIRAVDSVVALCNYSQLAEEGHGFIINLTTYWLLAVHALAIITFIIERWACLSGPLRKYYMRVQTFLQTNNNNTKALSHNTGHQLQLYTTPQRVNSAPTFHHVNDCDRHLYKDTSYSEIPMTASEPLKQSGYYYHRMAMAHSNEEFLQLIHRKDFDTTYHANAQNLQSSENSRIFIKECLGRMYGEQSAAYFPLIEASQDEIETALLFHYITEEIEKRYKATWRRNLKHRTPHKCKWIVFRPRSGIFSSIQTNTDCSSKYKMEQNVDLRSLPAVSPSACERHANKSSQPDGQTFNKQDNDVNLNQEIQFWLNWPYPNSMPYHMCTIVVGPRKPFISGNVLNGILRHPAHKTWAYDSPATRTM